MVRAEIATSREVNAPVQHPWKRDLPDISGHCRSGRFSSAQRGSGSPSRTAALQARLG